MGYPERLLTAGERIVREFRPHWRLLVIPFGWTMLFAAAIVLTWISPPEQAIFDWVITGAAVIAMMVLGLYPFISWWFTWYVLTTERLITRRGVLARTGMEMPLENINDVSFSQSILERVLRSGDLMIESAGEMGQSRFRDIPTPEEFQSLLYRIREDRAKSLTDPKPLPDTVDKLERLARLYQDGMIDRREYEAEKRLLRDDS
jgi:membrane protein YdbS with pleckstrin-like domain